MIGFLCDIKFYQNYRDNLEAYRYLHGRHSATGYYYWILKNHGTRCVCGITQWTILTNFDIIVYHYDNRDIIDFNAYKTIQVVTDRPCVEGNNIIYCC